jgi:hypothetical protein
MTWDVEYTDEFGGWWGSLTEDEQVSLAASVQLLEERRPSLGTHTAAASMALSTGICASFGRSMAGDHFARCTPSIRAGW